MRPRLLFVACAASAAVAGWWWVSGRPEPQVRTDWRLHASVLVAHQGDLRRGVDGAGNPFDEPFGLAVRPDGGLLVSDGDRLLLRGGDGRVTAVAGGAAGFRDGVGASAQFSTLSALAVASDGSVDVADTGNHAIRSVSSAGVVTTRAGNGRPGFRDGRGNQAEFNGPVGVVRDAAGVLYVADTYNDAIRVVSPDGGVSTLAGGSGPGYADGTGAAAQFDTPTGLTINPSGDLLVADTGNGRIRRVDARGEVTTVTMAGAYLGAPLALVAGEDGSLLVADEDGAVLRRARDGQVQVVAGGAGRGYGNGLGASARFRRPAALVWLETGHLVVADTGNARLRLVTNPLMAAITPPPDPRAVPRFEVDRFRLVPLPWPVAPFDGPHEVAGTHGERRGTDGAERFHTGVDIREPQGTPVHAVRDGRVSSPLANGAVGTLNEYVRVGDVTYVHLRAGRAPEHRTVDTRRYAATYGPGGELTRLRVRRGARFATGDRVGTVNAFNHVHLAVGWPGDEHNPLDLRLLRFTDTIPPTIASRGIQLFSAAGQPLDVLIDGRTAVHGRVQVVLDAWDQADGNVPWRRLGLYAVGYQVLHPDGRPAVGFEQPRMTQRFDRLGADPDAARVIYAPGSGIPVYGNRRTRFLYIVTSTLQAGVAAWGAWDTRQLSDGDYVLRVIARDVAGNEASARRDLAVRVVNP